MEKYSTETRGGIDITIQVEFVLYSMSAEVL